MNLQANTPSTVLSNEPQLMPEHKYLAAFVGQWRVEGMNAEEQHMCGKETYEMHEGGFFLVNKFYRQFGNGHHTGIGFIGYNSTQGKFLGQSCDNLGFARTYEIKVEDHLLTFSGEHERATMHLASDGQSMEIYWERSEDGESWTKLCELKGTKTQ